MVTPARFELSITGLKGRLPDLLEDGAIKKGPDYTDFPLSFNKLIFSTDRYVLYFRNLLAIELLLYPPPYLYLND